MNNKDKIKLIEKEIRRQERELDSASFPLVFHIMQIEKFKQLKKDLRGFIK